MSPPLTIGPDRDGRVVHCVDGRLVADAPALAEQLPCPEGQLEPGAVDAHTHLYSGLAPLGMPAAEPAPTCFVEILERVWWRLDRALDADSLRASARLYLAESLLLGTTSLVDHHESPELVGGSLDILASAFSELGARGLLCYGATERNGGDDEAMQGLSECRRFARDNREPRLRAMVGLHASFTVSDATVRAAGRLCRDLDLPLHMHVAEAAADVEDAQGRGYGGPLERLTALGALVPGSVLAHGVHLSEGQVRAAEEAGAWLVHNPRSNEGNAVGFAHSLVASEHVALGTDGWPADMAAEQAAAVRLGLPAPLAQARLDGGRHLVAQAFDAHPNDLEPGSLADVVVRRDGQVQHVVVDGRLVVRDGVLLTADLDHIRAQARAIAPTLWKHMAAR